MTYDLQNVGFVDAPLVLKNNASDFRASFGVTMPARIVERRFFSMGVDAYRLALRWVKWQTQIEFEGTTGKLSFNQLESSTVQRTAQPALIESNKIRAVTEERLKNIRIRPIAP